MKMEKRVALYTGIDTELPCVLLYRKASKYKCGNIASIVFTPTPYDMLSEYLKRAKSDF